MGSRENLRIEHTPLGVLWSVKRKGRKSATMCRWPGGQQCHRLGHTTQQCMLDFRWGDEGFWFQANQGGGTFKWRFIYFLRKHVLCGYSMPSILLDTKDAQQNKCGLQPLGGQSAEMPGCTWACRIGFWRMRSQMSSSGIDEEVRRGRREEN